MIHSVQNIQVSWLDERQQAVCLTFCGPWTWEDFYLAQQAANALIRTDDNEFIDLVYHFVYQSTLPKGYYTHLLRIAGNYPEQIGMVLWVGCHPVARELVFNITRYHKELARTYAFIDTLEEASEIIGP